MMGALVNASACEPQGAGTSIHSLLPFPQSVTPSKVAEWMLMTCETLNACSCLHQVVRTRDVILTLQLKRRKKDPLGQIGLKAWSIFAH